MICVCSFIYIFAYSPLMYYEYGANWIWSWVTFQILLYILQYVSYCGIFLLQNISISELLKLFKKLPQKVKMIFLEQQVRLAGLGQIDCEHTARAQGIQSPDHRRWTGRTMFRWERHSEIFRGKIDNLSKFREENIWNIEI